MMKVRREARGTRERKQGDIEERKQRGRGTGREQIASDVKKKGTK